MQFALVDNMEETPLGATEGISIPFTAVSGTPTCELPDIDVDTTDESYFADYFDVYEPESGDTTSTITMIVEVTLVCAIALIGALFFGGVV